MKPQVPLALSLVLKISCTSFHLKIEKRFKIRVKSKESFLLRSLCVTFVNASTHFCLVVCDFCLPIFDSAECSSATHGALIPFVLLSQILI